MLERVKNVIRFALSLTALEDSCKNSIAWVEYLDFGYIFKNVLYCKTCVTAGLIPCISEDIYMYCKVV